MGERLINPLLNTYRNFNYKRMIIINPYRFGAVFDADAQNYFNVVEGLGGYFTSAQKSIISGYFISLKSSGIWTKIKRLHIPVNDVQSFLVNAKTPNIFDLVFYGAAEINSDGIRIPLGTGGSNRFYVPSINIDHVSFDTHLALYVTEDGGVDDVNQIDFNFGSWSLYISFQGFFNNIIDTYDSANRLNGTLYTKTGLFLDNVKSNISHRFFRDGNLDVESNALNTSSITSGDGNLGSGAKRMAYFSLGASLTEDEEIEYNYVINDLQRSFGRNIYT